MKLPRAIAYVRGNGAGAFVLRACLLLLLLGLVSVSGPFGRWVEAPLIQIDAALTHYVLKALGFSTTLSERVVTSSTFSIEVIPECTGIFTLVILLALTFAYPVPWARKLMGFAVGSILIFLLNLVRLVSLFLVGRSFPELFEDIHLYVWQSIFVLAVAVYWYAWARKSFVAREPAKA